MRKRWWLAIRRLIAESLSWFTAFKLAIFVVLLGALAGVRRGGK